MSTALSPFTYAGQQVRVVTDSDGEPWFVASDVTALLGYRNGRDAVAGLPERMKSSVVLSDGTPGNPNRATLSESGVNRLIMRSTLPAAERIQDWLAEDVMPAIRRTGSYGVAVPDISTPAGVLAMAEQFAATARALVASEAKVAELEPKAEVADRFLTASTSSRLIGQVAKELDLTEKNLRQFMRDEGLIFTRQLPCGHSAYDFYARHAAHFEATETPVEHGAGRVATHYTVRVTPRGVELITKRLATYRKALVAGVSA